MTDPPEHVPADSEAARNWWKLQERGDVAGLQRLAERLEETETPEDVRGLLFCGCGCGRLSIWEMDHDPGELIERRWRLVDGTPVVELPLKRLLSPS